MVNGEIHDVNVNVPEQYLITTFNETDNILYLSLFFFQAEDGIRDLYVTGVQTCALPISACAAAERALEELPADGWLLGLSLATLLPPWEVPDDFLAPHFPSRAPPDEQDEEDEEEDGEEEIGRASCRERGEIGRGATILQ